MYKSLLLAFLVSLTSLTSQAQIPNGGMEDWTITTILLTPIEHPEDYFTSDFFAPILGSPTGHVTKSTDADEGTYSALLENQTDSVGAFMATGSINTSTFELTTTVPWTAGRPDKIMGAYKENLMGSDTGAMIISFYKDTAIIGGAISFFEPGSASSWTDFEDSVFWFGTGDPDSVQVIAVIGVQSLDSTGAGLVTIGSQLYLDDLSIPTTSGVSIPIFNEVNVTVHPNPSSQILNFSISGASWKTVEAIRVFNVQGQEMEVDVRFLQSKKCIDLGNLDRGNYVFELLDQEGKTIDAGTFIKH